MKKLLLGIDVGTYSSKAVLVTLDGQIVRTAVVPHGISTPAPGHVEQDADAVWWSDVRTLCRMLFQQGPYVAHDVASIAVSAIGPCLLPLDVAGRPLRPGILYGVDTRASVEIDELETEIGESALFEFSLMGLTSQAVGPKIRWLQKHEPEVWSATRHLVSATSYLVFRLTGQYWMDRHTASHYMPLYNPATGTWDARYAAGLVDTEWLPRLGWSDQLAGQITEEAANATGLIAGTPVTVGAVDALSEAISVGVVEPGDLMVMYGSTTFFVLVQDVPTPDRRVWSVAGAFAGQFNLAAGMSTTGSLTEWFKNQLARDLSEETAYAELFEMARRAEPGSNNLLVLPYFSGERTPVNDPHARGVIAGLSLMHTRDHLYRATLEGVGYGVRHNLEAMASIGAQVKRIVAVGGGAKTDTWLQIVSDICGKPQEVPEVTVGASYGDAFLAGCAAGLVRREDIANWVKRGRLIEPDPANSQIYEEMYGNYLDLYSDTRRVVHRLALAAPIKQKISAMQPG